ncbi:hypothetical protein [Streptomyces sp. LUP30]|uniref:hypothetical protein n=1 Tax=Streptomyces sp. LUP30 TaxID=1890285 RepID=UPI00085198E3|nr:hypothetical protein [Streptomyces sp. LUP30]
MTLLLAAVLALAAGWCIGHRTGRTLRRASAQVDAIIRTTIPDPAPMPDWERIAEQTRYDEAFGQITRHWNEDAA